MKWPRLIVFCTCFVACTGQDRILQEDTERGITLRQTNIETIGCWGEKGVGGTTPTVRLEFRAPSGFYQIPNADVCTDRLSFDASTNPVRIRCNDEVRPFYRLGGTRGVLGEPGVFVPLHEAADYIVEKRGQPILRELLTEAHEREKMVETLVTLGDTECGDYWQVSFDGLRVAQQETVIDHLRKRTGSSELRDARIQKNATDRTR